MQHQDFKVVTFNTKSDKKYTENVKELEKKKSQKIVPNDEIKIEPPKKLGLLISQARSAKGIKSQKDLANLLGVTSLVIKSWENNTVIPSNLELSKIEKVLGVKLPRSKKIKKEND